MNAIAAPGIWLGDTERALRVIPLVLGVGFVLATWLLARRTVGAVGAAWAVVVLAGSRSVVRLSTDLLSDVPAAACLIAALAVIVDEVDRADGPRWRIVLAAPLLAAALYVRYGSAVPIAVIVVAALAVGARTLARRPLPVIATAILFVALLVPHFVQARAATGSALGILLASRGVPQQEYLAQGLVTYLTSNPFQFYGTLTPIAMVAGVTALRVREPRRLLVWLVAVGSLVAIGLTTHAQARYILVSIALLVVLGVDQILRGLSALPPRARRVASFAIVGALVAVWLLLLVKQRRIDENRRHAMRGTLAAAQAIRADAHGERCAVVGYHSTQLEWYSGCHVPLVMDPGTAAALLAAGERVYVVRDYTPTWVPAPQPVFAEMPGVPQLLLERPGVVEVIRLAPR
jgi:4-amino-4-deoxy-L-arabinose transferase-like glycosyltransferase